ncbi:SGNH/GDSL hydrolase family protein [Dyella sp. 20L07]|uniref:SGNH/GDSL hydrolase family protein n=1 Tax=Dyella sp. 20L07 TaxID=3384240 RepID=UPI003D2BF31E
MAFAAWQAILRRMALAGMFSLVLAGPVLADSTTEMQRVLFVGNSLTYTNSLPAIFELTAQAQAGSPNFRADMYVRGGATLTELDKDAQLHALLDSGVYQVVVLQERGGNDLCVNGKGALEQADPDCEQLVATHIKLADEARTHGASVLYLGTYQTQAYVSNLLVNAEQGLSTQMAASYLEISESLRRQRELHPALPWLYTDNAHPGIATTTLMALRVYQALHPDQALVAFDLCTTSNLYTTKLRGHPFIDHDEMTAPTEPRQCLLDKAQLQVLTQAVKAAG